MVVEIQEHTILTAGLKVQPLDPNNTGHLEAIALRMRETLIEVVGPEGRDMYTLEWLKDRVLWHLRPEDCTGQVFVAINDAGELIGHAMARVQHEEDEDRLVGLIATIYILPAERRKKVAQALIGECEAWLLDQGAQVLAMDTAEDNWPLITLFEGRGYTITLRVQDLKMIRLSRDIP